MIPGDTDALPWMIDCSLPGGNIVVERVVGDDVYLHQDLRDTATDWFYWHFRITGAEGRTLRFHFTKSRAIGVRGPAMSLDQGKTWSWLGTEMVDGNSFACTFPRDTSDIRLSFAMPYQEAHWREFIVSLGNSTGFSCQTLCTTAKGCEVEYLLAGSPDPHHRVAVMCRHHCCEMMTNYVLEGLLRWMVESSDDRASWMRNWVQLLAVPFVDKDGVEDGDQGKLRLPRDHGRDYEGESIHVSTHAIRQMLPQWGKGLLRVGLDLHCPHVSGAHNEEIYLVGSRNPRTELEQRRFGAILESAADGPLPFSSEGFLPFGVAWNVDVNFRGGRSFAGWVTDLPGVTLGSSIEIPYANADGAEVNQESARRFGIDLGKALADYLQEQN